MNKRHTTGETAMETTMQIDPDLTPWLDRMVKEYGHNRLIRVILANSYLIPSFKVIGVTA